LLKERFNYHPNNSLLTDKRVDNLTDALPRSYYLTRNVSWRFVDISKKMLRVGQTIV